MYPLGAPRIAAGSEKEEWVENRDKINVCLAIQNGAYNVDNVIEMTYFTLSGFQKVGTGI